MNFGYILKEKRQSKISLGIKYEKIFNQIWIKK